ncbi:MAG: Jag N-terminal domain-containing protein [Clostridia bacterium]|nr:Jag N-terminal domain-containing protein [Clostridia bacterium]
MKREIIATGKDVQEAQANAAALLGASETDTIEYEVLDFPTKGFLGIGAKPAKVKATIEMPDAPQRPARNKKHADEAKNFVAPKEPAPVHEAMKTEAEVVLTKIEAAEGEDLSYDFVNRLIANLGINASATLYRQDEGGRRICIDGEDAGMLIGHHGETLDALQYLSNLACAKKNVNGERLHDHVTVDIEGYRAKREETLRALARRMAAKALRNKRNVMLEPMNAYERRIIHSEVQNIAGVSTNSIGSDNNRKVVIYLADKKAPADDNANV